MPTHEEEPRFWDDYDRLTKRQQELFQVAVVKFVTDLRLGRFRPGLRVAAVQAHPGVYEMTWAPDGRATFSFGRTARPGERHVIWRRIGTHDISLGPDERAEKRMADGQRS